MLEKSYKLTFFYLDFLLKIFWQDMLTKVKNRVIIQVRKN